MAFLFLTCRIFEAILTDKTQGTDLEMWSSLGHIAYSCVALIYLCRPRGQCHCDLFSEIYKHILFLFSVKLYVPFSTKTELRVHSLNAK